MSTVEESSRLRIISCQGLVKSIAVRVHSNVPRSVELDDLIGYGELGLTEAARDFDPDRGIQFSTYAYYRIRGAIYDGLAKITWPNRLRRQQLLYQRQADEILRAEAETAEAGELPPEDQATRLGRVSERLFVAYLAAHSHVDLDENGELVVEDRSAVPPSDHAARAECCRLLREVITTLPPDAHQLIHSVYFDGQNLTEASENLGISRSWASRLHARTLERLADSLRRRGVDG
jgi:RNA polymerase sigma factor for flagellar operon FliA